MGRSKVVKFQLFLLFVLAAVLGYTALKKPPIPSGNLVQTRMNTGRLYHQELKLDADTRLVIEAAGSLETLDPGSSLKGEMAAYPWIIDRVSRETIWQLTATDDEHAQTLIEVTDTLTLPAGTYDVFFTTYGRTKSSRRRQLVGHRGQWTSDKDNWKMVIQGIDDAENHISVDGDVEWEAIEPTHENAIWTSHTVGGRAREDNIFLVSKPTTISIYSAGELCESTCDYAYVKDIESDATVWRMTEENSKSAGGSKANRIFEGDVTLQPGTYEIGYVTDSGHDFYGWHHNPPLDPTAWGVYVGLVDGSSRDGIHSLDLWGEQQPLIQISRVKDNEEFERFFEVSQPTLVFLSAMGELSSSGSRYDFADLTRMNTGRSIWTMSYEESKPAGGHSNNRLEESFIKLDPGSYKLTYKTDGSHSFEHFSNGTPRNKERWGVALFAVGDASGITVTERAAVPEIVTGTDAGEMVVDWTGVGNSERSEDIVIVTEPSILMIYALGEISRTEAYDYGQIVDSEGIEIWRLSRSNSSHAGGVDRNRKFEGQIRVEPGVYTASFVTDSGHAFGDFGSDGPDEPTRWGLRVFVKPLQ